MFNLPNNDYSLTVIFCFTFSIIVTSYFSGDKVSGWTFLEKQSGHCHDWRVFKWNFPSGSEIKKIVTIYRVHQCYSIYIYIWSLKLMSLKGIVHSKPMFKRLLCSLKGALQSFYNICWMDSIKGNLHDLPQINGKDLFNQCFEFEWQYYIATFN